MKRKRNENFDEAWSWIGDIEVKEGQTLELEYGTPQLPKLSKKKNDRI